MIVVGIPSISARKSSASTHRCPSDVRLDRFMFLGADPLALLVIRSLRMPRVLDDYYSLLCSICE